MKKPSQSDSLEVLKRAFWETNDLTEKAILANMIWRGHGKTFSEIDSMLCVYENWCCRHMWRARLSDKLVSSLQNSEVSAINARRLSFLEPDQQDDMVLLILEQDLSLKHSTGIHALLLREVENYRELEARRIHENRSVVPVLRAQDKVGGNKDLPNFSCDVALSDAPRYIRSLADLLEFIEGLPLEDVGEDSLTPQEILELRAMSDKASLAASGISRKLTLAWKRKLALNAPGAIKAE